jgi:hypothetical protein
MRLNRILIGIVMPIVFVGCVPWKTTYRHLVFSENPAIQVLERSNTVEKNSKGKPLKGLVTGLPVRSRLVRPTYSIEISTPINAEPVVFLRLENKELLLEGAHLKPIQGDFQYSFLVTEAKGAPLQLVIIDRTGNKVGTESLSYTLISRGHTWSIDAL